MTTSKNTDNCHFFFFFSFKFFCKFSIFFFQGMEVCLELNDLEAQIEGLRAIQIMVLGNVANNRAFIFKGGAGIIIRSMSMFRRESITNTFEACRAFTSVIGMGARGNGLGGIDADELDERKTLLKIEMLEDEELQLMKSRNNDDDESKKGGITAVDYHTIVAFMNVVVPALESSTPLSNSIFHRQGSEAVQYNGMRAVGLICGAGDDRYPSLAVDLHAAAIVREGMSEFVHESERVAYEGIRCLGYFATSLEDNHRDVLVIEEGNAISATIQAMTTHQTSKRLQREGCNTILQLGIESPENALLLADQGYGTCLKNALKNHSDSLALAFGVAECIVGLSESVIQDADQKWEDIVIEDDDEEDEGKEGKEGKESKMDRKEPKQSMNGKLNNFLFILPCNILNFFSQTFFFLSFSSF